MKSLILALSMTLPVISVIGQERTAGAVLENQASWSTLENLADQANKNASNAHTRLNQTEKCAVKGMLYSPTHPERDGEGCISAKTPDPSTLDIKIHTETLCKRHGNYTVVSSCKSGERLLGCGGGPGDQNETNEYWVLMPDFQSNRCVGHVGQPACYDSGWSQTMVSAICYTP